ncbi:MAG TPA: GNAT family protein [Bacteroidota bacterium]|nr:GNAT family protein [Bacteroidota bacterium]
MITLRIDRDLVLRQLADHDALPLFNVIDRNRVYLRQWLPWLDTSKSPVDTLNFIRTTLDQFANNDGFAAGIWYENAVVGTIGFHRVDWLNRSVEIGYWLSADCQGKGIVTRSCIAFIEYAFSEWHLHRVQIRCAVGNARSCKIPERLGFVQEGMQRHAEFLYDHYADLIIYGMLENEWKAKRLELKSRFNAETQDAEF